MTSRRSGLGRGLDALIPNLNPVVEEVDVDLIAPNPQQPRRLFDPETLAELAESIREHGVIQPLIVSRPRDGGRSAPFQLIAPVHLNYVEVIHVSAIVTRQGRHHTIYIAQRSIVPLSNPRSAGAPIAEVRQLDSQSHGLQRVEPTVAAYLTVLGVGDPPVIG